MAWLLERDITFDSAIRQMKKDLPRAEADILGEFKGRPPPSADPIPAFGRKLWKARAPCSDRNCGKRGGLRVIYYWDSDLPNYCCLGPWWSKKDREDLSAKEYGVAFASVKARFAAFKAAKEAQDKAGKQP